MSCEKGLKVQFRAFREYTGRLLPRECLHIHEVQQDYCTKRMRTADYKSSAANTMRPLGRVVLVYDDEGD